jgi:hypothetical protein
MTRPYNPPVQQRIGVGRIIEVDSLEELQIIRQAPVWKPIGEASDSLNELGMWIERIDGFRVAVQRHFMDSPFRRGEPEPHSERHHSRGVPQRHGEGRQ